MFIMQISFAKKEMKSIFIFTGNSTELRGGITPFFIGTSNTASNLLCVPLNGCSILKGTSTYKTKTKNLLILVSLVGYNTYTVLLY